MSEVNQNPNSFDAQSDSELVKTIELTFHEVVKDEVAGQSDSDRGLEAAETSNKTETCNSKQKIDWHKIAHKLREHNRKLLKQVFQLEQEKADLENRLHQQLEKSYNSDTAIAQQAEQIENGLEQISLISEQLEISRHEAKGYRNSLEHLTKQLKLSQKQTARLERECALLQESHNEKAFQLIDKDKQIQQLSARLGERQPHEHQHTLALDKYEPQTLLEPKSSKSAITQSSARRISGGRVEQAQTKSQPIQVWSVTDTKNKIPLPAAASRPSNPTRATSQTSEWPAPAIVKPKQTKKIKSLAAVKLPQFSRQS
ncbi:hypothetical protein [Myxosarcina sp. GI1(2024)]